MAGVPGTGAKRPVAARKMANVIVKIPYVTWRDGRPRFIPGKALRQRGFKGEDLRHPDGVWFSVEETGQWALQLADRIKARPERPRTKKPNILTIGALMSRWLNDPRMKGKDLIEGKKHQRALSSNTSRSYRGSARIVEKFDNAFVWAQPANTVTPRGAAAMLDRIWQAHGLAQARAIRAALSAAYSWGIKKNLIATNPFRDMPDTLPMPAPRIRFGEVSEMAALVAAADAIGLPEIGDAITLGLWCGQRQNDRLELADAQFTKDGILCRQSKKHGAPLLIPQAPELKKRLIAARKRRAGWRINYPHIILDEEKRRPFTDPSRYRKQFAKVRAHAAKTTPSLADFHDQDLRDTAITWLALAGNDVPFIIAITGHELKSAQNVLKHYLGKHPDMARTAIGRLVTWFDAQGREEA